MESCSNLIEHTHFKKKKAKKSLKSLTRTEIGGLENAGFDRYLEAVLSRGGLLLFLNGEWAR